MVSGKGYDKMTSTTWKDFPIISKQVVQKAFLFQQSPMWHCLLMGSNSHGYPQLVPGRCSASLANTPPSLSPLCTAMEPT